MTEKLVIKAKNTSQNAYNPIFVSAELHSQIKHLARSTGYSMRDLTDMLISFAIKNSDIEPAEDGVKPE